MLSNADPTAYLVRGARHKKGKKLNKKSNSKQAEASRQAGSEQEDVKDEGREKKAKGSKEHEIKKKE